MANPSGMRNEGWREDDSVERASRKGQPERESFDNEGQAPGNPQSSSKPTQESSAGVSGPRLVPPSPKIGADYTRPPFAEGDQSGSSAEVGYGEPLPERNYPHAYDADELQNSDLNPMMESPSKPGGTLSVLVLFTGALIMLVLIALLFYQFAVPSPRAP